MLICISDFWLKRQYFELKESITEHSNETILEELPALKCAAESTGIKKQSKQRILKRVVLAIDGISAFYWLREITHFRMYRWNLLNNKSLGGCQLLWLQIEPPKREIIDYKWNDMLAHTLWIKIECDYLMSWLSTLGGGYSALGEQFTRCAETAGKISLKQLAIGMRLGDPFLQARCKLYYSLSLIQIGKLRAAKYLIREQYKFARNHKETDSRLVKMCLGIWLRLQYEYRLRIEEHEKLRILLMAAGDK